MKIDHQSIYELLHPRFIVIEEYPKCKFKIGEILLPVLRATFPWYHTNPHSPIAGILLEEIEKYPHLFKKLNWWEYRTEDEMPMYLKHSHDKINYSYHKILKWDMNSLDGFVNLEKRQVCGLMVWSPEYSYIPITEEEYNKKNDDESN